jgi:chemotaxis protein MotB
MATFADMATLLMAFFVLILSFAEMNIPLYKQIAGSIQAAFGVKRIASDIIIPKGRTVIATSYTPVIAERTLVPDMFQESTNTQSQFLIKNTEDNELEYDLQQDWELVQETLKEAIKTGRVKVRIVDEKIVVELRTQLQQAQKGSIADGEQRGGRIEEETLEIAEQIADVQAMVVGEIIVVAVTAEDEGPDEVELDKAKDTGDDEIQAIDARYEDIKVALSQEIRDGRVEVLTDGERIFVRLNSEGSFESGAAQLSAEFEPLLAKLSATLETFSGVIQVAGHTDNLPVVFSQRFRSNWDLSAARAAAVADFMALRGPDSPAQIEIAGYGDTQPISPNDTAEGRAKNRRIEVIIQSRR